MKIYLISLAVCSISIAIFYFIWFSPLLMALAGILVLYLTIVALFCFIPKSEFLIDIVEFALSFIAITIIVLTIFMNDTRYISKYGDYRHIYPDCVKMEGNKKYKVCKFSAIIWGCYSDCDLCVSKQEKNLVQKSIDRERKKKEEDLRFIERQIEELNNVKQKILDGEDVIISNYEFVKDVDTESEEGDEESIYGIPSRYE